MIIVQKRYQKSVDMGVKLEENMCVRVGFFIFGPHTPVTFLVKYPPPGLEVWVPLLDYLTPEGKNPSDEPYICI